MEKFKNIKIKKLGVKLEKLGDLIAYEGPILSHFVSETNEDYLFFWVESDDDFNRWMIYKTDYNLLNSFFKEEQNNRELILSAPDGFVYIIDINDDLDYKNIIITPLENIPAVYLPSEDSFYEKEQYEPYATQLQTYLDHHFSRIVKLKYPSNPPPISIAMEPEEPIYKKTKKKD